jgi:hypothetical protein
MLTEAIKSNIISISEKVIPYHRLNSTGWCYVAKADAEELLEAM